MARQIRKSYYPGWPNFLTKMIRRTDPVIPRNAFTFNAAGVSVATKVREGGWKLAFKSEKSINAYITITDPLNNIQNRSMLLPSVNGNRKYVLPNRINGHSIYNFY